ncbi:UNVERIFIED_CONTAM: hypothetical protein FKN15_013444 [Acipenser sinensis]
MSLACLERFTLLACGDGKRLWAAYASGMPSRGSWDRSWRRGSGAPRVADGPAIEDAELASQQNKTLIAILNMYLANIYVFGVGEDIDEDEINLIASKKDKEKHVFKLENPEKLAETFEQMIGRGQQSRKIRLSVMAMTRRDESDSVGLCGLYREYNKESESEKTKKEKYPWHVSITITRQSGKEDCKGAVVSERHVLTAAHCFTTEEQAKDVKVIIDDSTIGTPGRSTGQKPSLVEQLQ